MVRGYEIKMVAETEGGFTVWVPALPGCVSVGESEEEALAMIQDALKLWLDVEEKNDSVGS